MSLQMRIVHNLAKVYVGDCHGHGMRKVVGLIATTKQTKSKPFAWSRSLPHLSTKQKRCFMNLHIERTKHPPDRCNKMTCQCSEDSGSAQIPSTNGHRSSSWRNKAWWQKCTQKASLLFKATIQEISWVKAKVHQFGYTSLTSVHLRGKKWKESKLLSGREYVRSKISCRSIQADWLDEYSELWSASKFRMRKSLKYEWVSKKKVKHQNLACKAWQGIKSNSPQCTVLASSTTPRFSTSR